MTISSASSEPRSAPLDFRVRSARGNAAYFTAADGVSGWASYKAARSANASVEASLDEIITANNRGLVREIPENADSAVTRRLRAYGFPWPTFVLGTGCLRSSDAQWSAVSDEVTEPLSQAFVRVLPDVPALHHLATKFVDDLTRSRTDHDAQGAGLAPIQGRSDDSWDHIARVTLAAMLATRLYGAAIQTSGQVLAPADHEVIVIRRDSPAWPKFNVDIAEPLLVVLAALETSGRARGAEPSVRQLGRLAAVFAQGLVGSDRAVRRTHVELLTAYAWYFLTDQTHIYPGWSELLLFEAFQGEDFTPGVSDLRPRLSSINYEGKWITDRLRLVSELSWETRYDASGPSARDQFYDSVAEILCEQAAAYAAFPLLGGLKPPLPTSFVTSFDVELEMALWKACADGHADDNGASVPGWPTSFIVVIPVVATTAASSNGRDASLHWVSTTITPDPTNSRPELTDLLADREWTEVQDGRGFLEEDEKSTYGTLPIVIRLAGSPLMPISTAKTKIGIEPETVFHALLLDEYGALNQTVNDFMSLSSRQTTSSEFQGNSARTSGLPVSLSEANPSLTPRFWMFLGTQLADSGVRLRLLARDIIVSVRQGGAADAASTGGRRRRKAEAAAAATSMALPESDDLPDEAREPAMPWAGRAGVVINRRTGAAEREVFQWHSLDIVASEQSALTHDLKQLSRDLAGRIDKFQSASGEDTK